MRQIRALQVEAEAAVGRRDWAQSLAQAMLELDAGSQQALEVLKQVGAGLDAVAADRPPLWRRSMPVAWIAAEAGDRLG